MPDAARIAQAQALEVPVTLQGAKTADETGRRELFTENATTTLVFDNGAVLNLRSRLTVGQAIFIHNEQNGREILCKVLEAPAENEPGYTDLEFTAADPEFWNPSAPPTAANAQSLSAAEAIPATNERPEAPADDTLAMMGATASKISESAMTAPGKQFGAPLREELVPAHLMVPEATTVALEPEPSAGPTTEPTEPTGEQIDAALRQMSAAPRSPAPAGADASPHRDSGATGDHAEDEKHLSAMMARDARLAKFAAIKEKQVEKIQREAASKDVPEGALPEADPLSEAEPVVPKIPLSVRLTTGKNAVYAQIAAWALVAVALGFIWNAVRGVFVHDGGQPVAAAPVPAKPKVSPATQPPSAGPAPAVSATAPLAAASRTAPANAVSAPAAPTAAKAARASAASVRTGTVQISNANRAPVSSPGAGIEENPDALVADTEAAPSKPRKPAEAEAVAIIPAKILSQPQPSFPAWANSLDVEPVVTLDVLIDEKGNVAETKVLSGSRALQRAAEQAVGLWQFVPARSGGQPVPTHVTLTVEFQR
jgi:TonB family protein